MPKAVLLLSNCDRQAVVALLGRYGLMIEEVDAGEPIRASYWGDEEAGLSPSSVIVRHDTPVHSILHEACHYICMDEDRRANLSGSTASAPGNAGGDYDEENAVCYLQILLAEQLPGMGKTTMCHDMDVWGYTFRLGNAKDWFEKDATDAYAWLAKHGLIDGAGNPLFRLMASDTGPL